MAHVSTPADRRRHPRVGGGTLTLTVDDRPARLIDWSFGGIGVQVDGHAPFHLQDEVTIRIRAAGEAGWDELTGRVQRVEAGGVVGIAFPDDGETTVRVLLRLVSHRMGGEGAPARRG